MNATRTPGVWRVAENCGPQMQSYSQPHGVTGTGVNCTKIICGCFGDIGGENIALANAAYIVRACNAHAGLVAALERIVQFDAMTHDMECRGMKDIARGALAAAKAQP